MVTSFHDRLSEACRRKASHLVVGIDPRPELLPDEFQVAPDDLEGWARSFLAFGQEVLSLCAPFTAVIKPQSAFFETLGSPGVRAFEDLAIAAREHDLLVIGDLKRGDIGSTAEAYAQAAFRLVNERPLLDAVTVSPYLGSDGILPFLALAEERGSGVYVLCKTSNPSSSELQDLELPDGKLIHEHMAELILRWGDLHPGTIGAVTGGTHPDLLPGLRRLMPGIPFLIPGVGAQGATMQDAAAGFTDQGDLALVNSSRGITFPWAKKGAAPSDWRDAIRVAAESARDELQEALKGRGESSKT